MRFDKFVFFSVLLSVSLVVRAGTTAGKHICKYGTKILNFSAHKYDGYDIKKVFLGLVIPIETLVYVVK